MSDHRLTFAEMVDITQAAPLDTSDADAEQQSADQSWADYERITKENAEAKAQNTRRIVALGLGYSDWPDEVLDAAADDSGFAEALCRQANTQRARDALKERDEWKLNRKPLDIATLSELLARPETPWRIKSREKVNVPGTGDGLIPAESNTLVVGIAKIGKTTFLGNLMHSLITGEPFLGRYNEIRRVTGSVVVLNYEVSGRTYARWLDEMEVPNEHLHIISLRGAPNPFRSERAKAELVKELQDRDCEILIVDPFTRAYVSRTQNQNDAGEVASFFGSLDEVTKSAGVPDAIVSHHTGWEGERARGSTELVGWYDAGLNMTQVGDDRYLSANGRDVGLAESQLLWIPEHRHLRLVPGSRAQVKAEKKFGGMTDAVVEIVTASPGLKVREIGDSLRANGVPMQRGDDSKACQQAVDSGRVRVEYGARNAKLHYPTNSGGLHLVPESPQ